MKPVSDFYPRLAAYVMGCPEPTMAQALVDASIAFCDDSMAIRHRLDAFTTFPGEAFYGMDAPAQQTISRVLDVWVNGGRLAATVADEVNDGSSSRGSPSTFYSRRNDSQLELVLYPTPDATLNVTAEVALRPLRSATSLENDLFDLWMDAIITGAMSRIYAIPDQPFSSPKLAQENLFMATRLSSKARVDASYGRIRGSGSVRMRPFA